MRVTDLRIIYLSQGYRVVLSNPVPMKAGAVLMTKKTKTSRSWQDPRQAALCEFSNPQEI